MLIDNKLAYAEIDEILNLLEDNYKEKIPKKVRDFFKEEKMNDYYPKIDINKPLIEQNLRRETIILLAVLELNYWCEDEEKKQYFLNKLAENEKEEKELEERYNPDNLFKKRIKDNTVRDLSMVEYKKSNFIQVVLQKIMRFFKRGK